MSSHRAAARTASLAQHICAAPAPQPRAAPGAAPAPCAGGRLRVDMGQTVSIKQAGEWVAKALMDAGERACAKGGGSISLAALQKVLLELARTPEAVQDVWQPYEHYEWQQKTSADPTDVENHHPAHGMRAISDFSAVLKYPAHPDASWSQPDRPYNFFQQRMGAGAFGGYGRKEMPHCHIPLPQPAKGDKPHQEPVVLRIKDGVPVQYGDFLGVGVRMVHPSNPRAPACNLGYSLLYVPPHVVQEPGSHETEEAYIIIKGTGHMWLNGRRVPVEPSTWIWLPPWTEHGIENTGSETLEIMVMTSPPNP